MVRSFVSLSAVCMLACSNGGVIRSKHPVGDSDGIYRPDLTPPVADCYADPDVIEPGQLSSFIGEESHDPDGIPLITYAWKLATKPEGSQAKLPNGAVNRPDFAPDVAGVYVAQLVVYNDRGSYSRTCDAELHVNPSQTLYIEARAERPDDIQLILVKSKQPPTKPDGSGVCSTAGCQNAWGSKASAPDIVRDGGGDGLLALGLEQPGEATYTIALWDGPGDIHNIQLGENRVWTHVFVDGTLALSIDSLITGEPGAPQEITGSLKEPLPVARVSFPSGKVEAL